MAKIQVCYPGVYAGGFLLLRDSEVGGVIARGLLPNGSGANVGATDLAELRERLEAGAVQPLAYFSSELEKLANDNGWGYDASRSVLVPRENYAKLGAAMLELERRVGGIAAHLVSDQPLATLAAGNAEGKP